MPFSLIFTIIIFTGLFILLEPKSLIQRREYKELIIAGLLLMLGFVYGLDYALDWQALPNPNRLLIILQPISESVDKFFQVTG